MKPRPGKDPDLTAMAVREVQENVASIDEARERLDMPQWTASTSLNLSPVQIRELTAAVQRELLKQAQRNPRRPGSAA